jgi:hypothetical protein
MIAAAESNTQQFVGSGSAYQQDKASGKKAKANVIAVRGSLTNCNVPGYELLPV